MSVYTSSQYLLDINKFLNEYSAEKTHITFLKKSIQGAECLVPQVGTKPWLITRLFRNFLHWCGLSSYYLDTAKSLKKVCHDLPKALTTSSESKTVFDRENNFLERVNAVFEKLLLKDKRVREEMNAANNSKLYEGLAQSILGNGESDQNLSLDEKSSPDETSSLKQDSFEKKNLKLLLQYGHWNKLQVATKKKLFNSIFSRVNSFGLSLKEYIRFTESSLKDCSTEQYRTIANTIISHNDWKEVLPEFFAQRIRPLITHTQWKSLDGNSFKQIALSIVTHSHWSSQEAQRAGLQKEDFFSIARMIISNPKWPNLEKEAFSKIVKPIISHPRCNDLNGNEFFTLIGSMIIHDKWKELSQEDLVITAEAIMKTSSWKSLGENQFAPIVKRITDHNGFYYAPKNNFVSIGSSILNHSKWKELSKEHFKEIVEEIVFYPKWKELSDNEFVIFMNKIMEHSQLNRLENQDYEGIMGEFNNHPEVKKFSKQFKPIDSDDEK